MRPKMEMLFFAQVQTWQWSPAPSTVLSAPGELQAKWIFTKPEHNRK